MIFAPKKLSGMVRKSTYISKCAPANNSNLLIHLYASDSSRTWIYKEAETLRGGLWKGLKSEAAIEPVHVPWHQWLIDRTFLASCTCRWHHWLVYEKVKSSEGRFLSSQTYSGELTGREEGLEDSQVCVWQMNTLVWTCLCILSRILFMCDALGKKKWACEHWCF